MALTPEKIALVRVGMARINAYPAQAGVVFYTNLFRVAPKMRLIWTGDVQAQATALINTLGDAVALLDQPQKLRPILVALADYYRSIGMSPRGYMAVHAALSEMVAEYLGDDPATEEAWGDTIDMILWIMLQAAHGPRSYTQSLAA